MKRRPCWPSAAAGLRSALSRNEPNTLPTPRAARPTPIAARPAPTSFAASASMINSLLLIRGKVDGKSVKIDRVVQVERRKQGEHIGLDRAHQQFEQGDADHQDEAGN